MYIDGSDSNYRSVWFPTWNNNTDSNESGAPFIRSIALYIVAGNHDVGATEAGLDQFRTGHAPSDAT